MTRSFKRLERVLKLEAKQGYKNKAVVGGIRQFATYWVDQARAEAVDEPDKAFVEQVAELLSDYGRLPGREARAKAVDSLLAGLKRRADRQPQQPQQQQRPQQPQQQPRERQPERPQRQPEAQQQEQKPKPAAQPVAEKRSQKQKHPREPKQKHQNNRRHPKKAEPQPIVVKPQPANNEQANTTVLTESVTKLRGVGAKMAEKLAAVGAETLHELLHTFPRRYDDYTLMKPINRIQVGEQVTIIGTIWETRARRIRGKQTLVQTTINDGTASIQANWFNQPWLAEKLPAGMQVVLSGKVEQYLGRPIFQSPEWEPLDLEPLKTRRIVPVYPLTKGLGSNRMRDIMKTAVESYGRYLPDPLPEPVRDKHRFLNLVQAVENVHFPTSQETLHEARRRLTFDELFLLQLGMMNRRQQWQQHNGLPLEVAEGLRIQFFNTLPYELTAAQKRVITEITADMAQEKPMNRLLQGDVGAGKTVVAAAAMVTAVRAGAQAALMAPTAILAEQHARSLANMLEPVGIQVHLLTGGTSAADKARINEGLASGEIQLVVGTHALIQESVTFQRLGLAVVDEQHRFGVEQRGALRSKGPEGTSPHLLVMSATPIPRTLALSFFGDLDLSVIDEMPPGRQEIKTRWVKEGDRERAYRFMARQIDQGRQAYIIYPLVEESDKIEAKAAVSEYERLQKEIFPEYNIGLVHGRMPAAEKEAVMRAFYDGELHILVATSVIEVGVDVPNSTIIMIEGANRFGLAQLHQFRGRVGRGQHQSYCILLADGESGQTSDRLLALEQTNDGFVLAEKDLELRGPGQFFGLAQSGMPEMQMAALTDMEMLELARAEAQALFEDDPLLEKDDNRLLHERVVRFWAEAADVS